MKVTFDELKTLYDTNPEAAEAKAKEIMNEYISTLTPERQQRAQAINWRIQQELRHIKDPTARLNRMVEMFWGGVKEFQQVLKDPEEVLNQRGEPSVVKFPKNQ